MKLIALILLLITQVSFADCEQIYVDRLDLAEKQFSDLDIADEYELAKPQIIKHPKIINKLLRISPYLKFSSIKNENKEIRIDLISKLKKNKVNAEAVINIKDQSRKAFFIKENIKDNYYYSLIFYVNLNCNPFTDKVTVVKSKKKKIKSNEKKVPNNK